MTSDSIPIIASELASITDTIRVAIKFKSIFNITGLSDILSDMKIDLDSLTLPITMKLYAGVKDFLKKPLYSDLKLDNEGDLGTLKNNTDFKEYIQDIISKIISGLNPYKIKVLNFIKENSDKDSLLVEELLTTLKIKPVLLMFILHDLQEKGQISTYSPKIIAP